MNDVKLRWQVIEDNGGGLHLAVLEDGRCIYYGHGYEHNEDGLRADVQALREGQHPIRDGWGMPVDVDDPQAAYDNITRYEYGWAVVADGEGIYYDRMGAAAQRVFGTGAYDGWKIRTGFLAGNLFAESGDDLGVYDVDASAARYAEMCREALESSFPGAEVEVPYERRASGATPIPLQTLVTDPEGVHYRPGDYGRGGRIAERVEEVCGEVWESWEWVVYEDAR